jgi:hypothetical protein
MSEDEAKDRLVGIKENFTNLEQAMLKAREKANANAV